MPTFRDTKDREWSIRFDGLTLRSLREELGIDLADVTGATYQKLESDDAELTAAVCYLCRQQLATRGVTKEQFAEELTGEALESSLQAIWGAAKVFFRPKLLSALELNFAQQKEAAAVLDQMRPAALLLNNPQMPESLRESVMGQIAGMLEKMTPGSSQQLPASLSVSGLGVTPSSAATALPDSVPSTPAA